MTVFWIVAALFLIGALLLLLPPLWSRKSNPAVALGAGMAAFCVVVFIKALGMTVPMLGPWFGY